MSDKTSIDWEMVEIDYRAGIKVLRQIGLDHGLSEGAIRKRAKRDKWMRNLAVKITAKADEMVRKEVANLVRKPGTQVSIATETQVIEANAELQFRIRMEHRKDITRSRSLFQKLLAEVEAETAALDLFASLGELLDTSGPDKTGAWRQDKLSELYKKVISQTGRIDNAKKLVEVLEKVIKLERQAVGIKDEESEDKGRGIEDTFAALGAKLRAHREAVELEARTVEMGA
jgi:hypothetical protein